MKPRATKVSSEFKVFISLMYFINYAIVCECRVFKALCMEPLPFSILSRHEISFSLRNHTGYGTKVEFVLAVCYYSILQVYTYEEY